MTAVSWHVLAEMEMHANGHENKVLAAQYRHEQRRQLPKLVVKEFLFSKRCRSASMKEKKSRQASSRAIPSYFQFNNSLVTKLHSSERDWVIAQSLI